MTDDFEHRLRTSLQHGAGRVSDADLLGSVATSYARTHTAGRRARVWALSGLAAATVAAATLVPTLWVQSHRPAAPGGGAGVVDAAPTRVEVTLAPGTPYTAVATTGGLEIRASARVRIVLAFQTSPIQADTKTYLEQFLDGAWTVRGPHNTDALGHETLAVTAPVAGGTAQFRLRVVGPPGYTDTYSPTIIVLAPR